MANYGVFIPPWHALTVVPPPTDEEVLAYVRKEVAERYHVDPDNVHVVEESRGHFNATVRLPPVLTEPIRIVIVSPERAGDFSRPEPEDLDGSWEG